MKPSALSILCLLSAACTTTPVGQLGAMLAPHDDHPVQVTALVVDLDSGETVLSRAPQRLCRPASTMKLLTTAAACRRDPDGVFETRLQIDALPAGRVKLIGAGDPLLSAADLRTLAGELRQQGATAVRGALHIVDPLRDANRLGLGWMWDDEPSTFQPAMSAAIIDAGCVTVAADGAGEQLSAKLLPVAGELELRVLGSAERLRITRGRYRDPNVVTVTGSAGDGPTQRRISVPVPARFTGHALVDALAGAGIAASGRRIELFAGDAGDPPAAQAVVRRSVADVVVHTNKVSDNLGAELLLRRLGSLREREPVPLGTRSEQAGIAVVAADLGQLGFDESRFRVADGSGVSHYNLVSAELLVGLLVDMHRRGGRAYELFRRSLPVAGVDGTLASRMQGTAAERRVLAKTGTISAVSNLAGYVETESGRQLAFAILCQNFVGSARPWRELQDRICAELAEL